MKISIVGAGFAGLAAGLLLRRSGHDVNIFEKFANPKPIGAGVLIQPTGLWAMRRLGIEQEMLAVGAKVDWLYGVNPKGRAVIDIRYGNWLKGAYGLGLHRGALFNALWQGCIDSGVQIHAGVAIDDVCEDEYSSTVMAAGTQVSRADFTIVCDGSHSAVRSQTGLKYRAKAYPWGAFWAVLPAAELGCGSTLLQWYRGAAQMLGLMPTGFEPSTGKAVVSLFWSVHDQAKDQVLKDGIAAWKSQVLALSPNLESIISSITSIEQLSWARYCDVLMPKYHTARCVVIGDAAHATSPQLGQGTNLALLDAVALNECINLYKDVPSALARYTAQRRGHLHFYSQASRLLTPIFQSNLTTIPWLRDQFLAVSARLPIMKGVNHQTLVGVRKGWLGGQLNVD